MVNDVGSTSHTVAPPPLLVDTTVDPIGVERGQGLAGGVTPAIDDVTPAATTAAGDVTLPSVPGGGRSWLGLLREHDFRQLFFADTGSQLGTQIGMLALPLAAAVTLHATAFEMGVVTAADTLPYLLLSLPAGAIADRSRRRRIMIVCDIARALTLASVPLA